MSASLVGSEMCIRDRSKAMLTFPIDARAARFDRFDSLIGSSVLGLRNICLLYTSDAADDM
eukprot:9873390-Alexandrium_andersonii.AAC.1